MIVQFNIKGEVEIVVKEKKRENFPCGIVSSAVNSWCSISYYTTKNIYYKTNRILRVRL